jgi:TolB-like protein
VFYEMLTGHRPFGGSNTLETAAAILKEDPEPISTVSTRPASPLEGVVARCLEKRPEDRFSSAHDLSLTLGAVDSVASGPVGVEKPARRWHWPVIVVVAILALIGFLVLPFPQGESPDEQASGDQPPRVVVLPFENLGAAEDEFFADGMTEEITARLASMEGLRVISRKSAVQYAGIDKSIQEMGRELDVGYVLEGTVRWARDNQSSRIRITPQLIRVEDDTHLWAETYDRVLEDVFEVQSEIAKKVTDQLGVTLVGSEIEAVELKPTDNVDAYQAYLQGRYYATRPHFTYENWNHAMAAYQRAVELDPEFALAHAKLARGHAQAHFFRHDLTPERLEAADAAAAAALELAPDSPHVRLDLGFYYLWAYRDRVKALEEFELAEAGLPDNAENLDAKAGLFEVEGRWDDALSAYERAFELSPRDAGMIVQAAGALWMLRRYPEAVVATDQAISLAPDAMWPYLYKALILWSWKGSAEQTRSVLDALPETSRGWGHWAWYWQEMYEARYGEAINRLESTSEGWLRLKIVARPNSLFAAQAYELLGEREKAAALYESSRDQLETEVVDSPDDPRLHGSLGIAYAALGRHEDAIREGLRATELLTRDDDGFYYLPFVIDLAHIYTILGEYDLALDQVEHLLTNPSWITAAFLEMDPRWEPLRNLPRYQQLIEDHTLED